MPRSVINTAPEQLRHRTAEEQETDRVVLRDLRRTKPTQLSETTEPRAKQPRIGERVHPSPLTAETVPQVDDFVQDPEDEKEDMMLVTAGARREICPSSPEWSTPTSRQLIEKGVKVETDMLIHDKRARVPLALEESALVPKERIVPSRMVLVERCDDDGTRFVKARLTAGGDQDPELLSQEPTNKCSDGFNERQSGYSAGHSLIGS